MADGGNPLDSLSVSAEVNPFRLPPERHGWRGLGLPGHHKRKWWTLVHNEQVLVTALLLIPGERSVRHSHETGELSIHYDGEMRPVVLWHPPGALHPVITAPDEPMTDEIEAAAEQARRATQDAPMAELLSRLLTEQRDLRARLEQLAQSVRSPSPTIIVDVLFPPFKTTIDDPAYPENKTVVGQWYD
jgi:hypothetical protein